MRLTVSWGWLAILIGLTLSLPIISYASDGPAMLTLFGDHSRCDNGCGYQFAEYEYYGGVWIYHPAWDFNLSNPNDAHEYVYAVADGTVILDVSGGHVDGDGTVHYWGVLETEHEVNGVAFYAQYGHVEKVFVKNGQQVKKGNRIAQVGDVGAEGSYHLHWEIRDDVSHPDPDNPGYWSGLQSEQNVRSWYRDPEPFIAELDTDFEASEQGSGNMGTKQGSLQWWHSIGSGTDSEIYSSDRTAKACYIQDYAGGSYGACAVVFDALGGARRAFTVRTGFWENGQDNGWSEIGAPNDNGPLGPYGMPITNEYATAAGTRQDFQKGYVVYENGQVTWSTYAAYGLKAPGWTSAGWNNQYSYLFARAYERNGGAVAVGLPSGNVYDYGSYKRQDFSGGTYGSCCIMYDLENAVGNPAATNEAYLLRTGFYEYYQANGGQSAFGCPSRDEYTTGDPGDAIQFFVRRVSGETQFHDMYYDASAQGQHVSWNSAYTTDYVSQNPTGQFSMEPGESRTLTVQFQNTGTTTWRNNAQTYPYDYVELKSCDSGGNVMGSFLNDPYDAGLGWLNLESPCTMSGSVAPGNTATFTFTGQVAEDAPLGLKLVYFRPNHSLAGLLDDWDGMHFQVNVVAPSDAAPSPDALIAVDQGGGNVEWRVCISNGVDEFGSWESWSDNFGDPSNQFFLADVDGNGYDDLLAVADKGNNVMEWRVALSNGVGAFTYDGVWCGDCGNSNSTFLVGDFTGDGKEDIAYGTPQTDPTVVQWRVVESTGSAFSSLGIWKTDFGDSGFRFFAGDFNGDGKCDIAHNYDADATTVPWRVALSTGSAFDGSQLWKSDFGDADEIHLVGDFNGDGKCDAAHSYRASQNVIAWYVALSTGSAFGGSNQWKSDFGEDNSTFFTGDQNHDGKADLIHATPLSASVVEWRVAKSTGSAFDASVQWKEDFGNEGNLFLLGNIAPTPGGGMGQQSMPIKIVESTRRTRTLLGPILPNPTQGTTTVHFTLAEEGHVSIRVFDIQGHLTRELVNDTRSAGNYDAFWDGRDAAERRVSDGIYFIILSTHDIRVTQKVVLLR